MSFEIHYVSNMNCHLDLREKSEFYNYQISQSPKGMPIAEDSVEMTFAMLTAISKI